MKFINKINKLPLTIMRKFAKSHDNLGDFTELHGGTWFLGFILTAAVAILAFVADWSVLYGIQYNTTKNETFATVFATVAAAVIQLLVLKFGGLAVKIKINSKAQLWSRETEPLRRDNQIQLRINTSLFLIGMACTLYLSLRTDQAVRAQAETYKMNRTELYNSSVQLAESEKDSVLRQFDGQRVAARAEISALRLEAVEMAAAPARAALAEKNLRYQRGQISKAEYDMYQARYNRKIASAERAPRQHRSDALLSFDKETEKMRSEIVSKYANTVSTMLTDQQAFLLALQEDISVSAAFTALWNVGLNAVSFILTIGLMFFARGANAHPSPSMDTDDDSDDNDDDDNTTSYPSNSTPLLDMDDDSDDDNTSYPSNSTPLDTDDDNNIPFQIVGTVLPTNNETPSESNANSVSNDSIGEATNSKIIELAYEPEPTSDDSNGMLLTVKKNPKGLIVVQYTKKNGEVVEYDRSTVQGLVKTYSQRARMSKKPETRRVNAHLAEKWSIAYQEMIQLYN